MSEQGSSETINNSNTEDMRFSNNKQLTTRLLVIYLVSALLFITSIRLHVHVNADTVASEQSSQIHISSVTGKLGSPDSDDEINISPLGVLKSNQNDLSLMAVFLLALLVAVLSSYMCIARLRGIHTRYPWLPFYGAPSMRAPPFSNS